jgi:biopolymer transport protein ExbD
MVVHHGMKIDLPSAGSVSLEKEDYIAITIDADNRLFLNKEPVEADGLAARVLALRGGESKPVFIDGDQKADLGLAIELLDDLKQAGIKEVSFSCKQETP